MCIAAPGKITKINGREVEVEYPGLEPRRALLSGNEVKVGDYVMVQMGIVINVLEKEEAEMLRERWEVHE